MFSILYRKNDFSGSEKTTPNSRHRGRTLVDITAGHQTKSGN